MTSVTPYQFGIEYLFEDIFPDAISFAGIKALSWPISYRYLCFGPDGAKLAAKRAADAPWAIGIGVSKTSDREYRGRVLNIIKMTTHHQKTSHFISSKEEERYNQWPQALAISDVFEVVGKPHVIDDLKLKKHPLYQAHDKIAPLNSDRLPIIAALRGWKIRLVDLAPLPATISLITTNPAAISREEGAKLMREVMKYERSAFLAKQAKMLNKDLNGGVCVCEGCNFRDESTRLFGAHHQRPLHLSVQETTPSMLTVLCPTCHRIVHSMAKATYMPMSVLELKEWYVNRYA